MKAVVVLDEMPDDCRHCHFRGMSYATSYCEFTTGTIPAKGKPDWCPIRQLPDIADHEPQNDWQKGFETGWNACIDAVMGEEKE